MFHCGATNKHNFIEAPLILPVPKNAQDWFDVPIKIGDKIAELKKWAADDCASQTAADDCASQTKDNCDPKCKIKGGFEAYNVTVKKMSVELRRIGKVKSFVLAIEFHAEWEAVVRCLKPKNAAEVSLPLSVIPWDELQEMSKFDKGLDPDPLK